MKLAENIKEFIELIDKNSWKFFPSFLTLGYALCDGSIDLYILTFILFLVPLKHLEE